LYEQVSRQVCGYFGREQGIGLIQKMHLPVLLWWGVNIGDGRPTSLAGGGGFNMLSGHVIATY